MLTFYPNFPLLGVPGAGTNWDPHAVSMGLSSQEVPNLDSGYFPRCKACITKDPKHITCMGSEGFVGQYKAMGSGATCAAGNPEEDLQGEVDSLVVARPCLRSEVTRGSALPETRACSYSSLAPGPNEHGLWPCGGFLCPMYLLASPARLHGSAVTAPARGWGRLCPARLWGGRHSPAGSARRAGRPCPAARRGCPAPAHTPGRRGLQVPPASPGAAAGSRRRGHGDAARPAPSAARPVARGRARGGAAAPLAAAARR